jgi:sRNA-binding protein
MLKEKSSSAQRNAMADKLVNDVLGPVPEHLRDLNLDGNICDQMDTEAWERAPAHLVKHDKEDGPDAMPYVDKDRHRAKPVSAASEARKSEKDLQKSALKAKYPARWGKRGQAKVIAGLEARELNELKKQGLAAEEEKLDQPSHGPKLLSPKTATSPSRTTPK